MQRKKTVIQKVRIIIPCGKGFEKGSLIRKQNWSESQLVGGQMEIGSKVMEILFPDLGVGYV